MTLTLSVNASELSVNLNQLLERVRQGYEIIIADAGRPVARLTPVDRLGARRTPGSAADQIVIGADFDAPLPESVLETFER